MKTVIYFGDNDSSIAASAQMYDSTASLIDHKNYKHFLESNSGGTYYTSIADLPKNLEVVYSILKKSDYIVYNPPLKWSDHRIIDPLSVTNSIQGLTEYILLKISAVVEVKNINLCYPSNFHLKLSDTRKTNNSQLWIVGCSVSHGIGVTTEERYGKLLSDRLKLECSFLTAGGSSIEWAANQILQSDLRSKDIVCWGLTNYCRIHYYYNNKLHHILSNSYTKDKKLNSVLPIDFIMNENRLFHVIESIKSVINYCKKLSIKLIIFPIVDDRQFLRFLHNESCFYRFNFPSNQKNELPFYDFGTDNSHPGPLTHKLYSNFLADIIENKLSS